MEGIPQYIEHFHRIGVISSAASAAMYFVMRAILSSIPKEEDMDRRLRALKETLVERLAHSMDEMLFHYGAGHPMRGPDPDHLGVASKQYLVVSATYRDILHYECSLSGYFSWLVYLLIASLVALGLSLLFPSLDQIVATVAVILIAIQAYIVINIRRRFNKVKEHERNFG